MNIPKDDIKKLAQDFYNECVQIRRHFHQYPELSGQEIQTGAYICQFLQKNHIPYQYPVNKTGVVALIKGEKGDGRCIALRSDMDALPIFEADQSFLYHSKNDGVMHACGHDLHMSVLLGTAYILNQLKSQFSGCVKFIFQPSEEDYANGAKFMIEEGVLENPKVEAIFACHVEPELQAGDLGFCQGEFLAATDEFFIDIIGKGGHGAAPHLCIDPIVIGSQVITALQQIVSRMSNPIIPAVLTFGKFIGDGRTNIIPNEVRIEGTLRSFNEVWRAQTLLKIKDIIESITKSCGGEAHVRIDHGYPSVYNHPELTQKIRQTAVDLFGENHVFDLPRKMIAEDFAYYGQKIPACLYRLGVANEIYHSGLHTDTFNLDENSIFNGLIFMIAVCLDNL